MSSSWGRVIVAARAPLLASSILLGVGLLEAGCATAPPPLAAPAAAPAPATTPAAAAATTPAGTLTGPPRARLAVAAEPRPPPPAPPVVDHPLTLLRGGRVLTAAGVIHERGHVLLEGGRITAVGDGDGTAPEGAVVVDVRGRTLTPGLIDTHSHMGVYPTPDTEGNSDGNEIGSPKTPEVWSEHGFWPQDAGLVRALHKGVTTIQVLPGSANLIGGRASTFHLGLVGTTDATSARALRFPDAPQGLKMACGQNPKRVYGNRGGRPSTRMGNVAGQRAAFQDALEYQRRWNKYHRDLGWWRQKKELSEQAEQDASAKGLPPPSPFVDDPPDPPGRDLGLETLAAVLRGEILVHVHCYRADEMAEILDIAEEFGFKIRSFHHAVEAYKIADRLAAEGVSVSTWVDWWGFKMESFDAVRENVALLQAAGARAIVHSDSDVEVRQLNQEAAKAWAAGRRLGVEGLTEDVALRWITANPAWALGIDGQTGTLQRGKRGDVVVWDGSPFSTYSRPVAVYVDGALAFDAARPDARRTDVMVGTSLVPPASAAPASAAPASAAPASAAPASAAPASAAPASAAPAAAGRTTNGGVR
jgi:imidazolonepropionase-like amidohydrolase